MVKTLLYLRLFSPKSTCLFQPKAAAALSASRQEHALITITPPEPIQAPREKGGWEPGWGAHFPGLARIFSVSRNRSNWLPPPQPQPSAPLPVALSKVTPLCSKANTKSEGVGGGGRRRRRWGLKFEISALRGEVGERETQKDRDRKREFSCLWFSEAGSLRVWGVCVCVCACVCLVFFPPLWQGGQASTGS